MTKPNQDPGGGDDRFRPEVYRELANLGWRVPQSEQEVRGAEEWIAANPTRVPDRLRELTDMDRQRESGGLLDRYLRNDERHLTDESKSKDQDRDDRDFDR